MIRLRRLRPVKLMALTLLGAMPALFLMPLTLGLSPGTANAQSYFNTQSTSELRRIARKRALAKKRRLARRKANRRRRLAKRRQGNKLRNTSSSRLLAKARSLPGALQIVVSLKEQKLAVYKGGQQIGMTRVSTGRSSNPSPTGVFSILQKRAVHFSNLYDNAPMPNMQRLTWSGIALHGGALPGYPASHGCIRQPYGFAKALFRITSMNDHVVLTKRRLQDVAPRTIQSALLFQATTEDMVRALLKDYKAPQNTAPSKGKLVRVSTLKLDSTDYSGITPPAQSRSADADLPEPSPGPSRQLLLSPSPEAIAAARAAMIKLADFEMLVDRLDRLGSYKKKSLRILISRLTARDRNKEVQAMLKELGYDIGPVDGRIGKASNRAIRALQKAQGLRTSSKVDAALVAKLRQLTNRAEPANGKLAIRQGYRDIFSVPVRIGDQDRPLGTHLFVATLAKPGGNTAWTVLTTSNTRFTPRRTKEQRRSIRRAKNARSNTARTGNSTSSAAQALARISMPDFARLFIADRLQSGTSLLIADNGYSAETNRSTDFIVDTRR